MKRRYLIRRILSVLFAVAVVFTVSVREVHYLFAQHDEHEHCENHLHAADTHTHCAVCKFDISTFTDEVTATVITGPVAYTAIKPAVYQSVIIAAHLPANSLRGPPARA